MSIKTHEFGTHNGAAIQLFELENAHGNIVKMTNYGAIIVSVEVPDRDGNRQNVNLGYSSLEPYLERHPYFGSTVGRYCNRIAAGKFELEGKSYDLAINNGPNHLHGGEVGFDRLVWEADLIEGSGWQGVRFSVISPDGQEGYPGTLSIVAEYTWNDSNELAYAFSAKTDAPTVLNLTNHAYWNLAGESSGDVLAHELQLSCDQYLAVDDDLIPTGELVAASGTSLDFAQPHTLGERIEDYPDSKGYDHCYVVNGEPGKEPRTCGVAKDPASGRVMEVLTTQPGMQLYTGNHLGGGYEPYSGFLPGNSALPRLAQQTNVSLHSARSR